MQQNEPRIPALPRAEWSAEAHKALAIMGMPPTPENEEFKSNITRTFANHPELSKAIYTLGRHVLVGSTLPPRLREIVILRVTWRHRCQYEWAQHINFAKRCGVSAGEIDAVKLGPEASTWSDSERQVLRAVDQISQHSKINDDTWTALTKHLEQRQIMDLLFTVGHYVMLSGALNSMQVQLEPEFRSSDFLLP